MTFFSSEIASLVFVLSDLLTKGLTLMIEPNKFSPACANSDTFLVGSHLYSHTCGVVDLL